MEYNSLTNGVVWVSLSTDIILSLILFAISTIALLLISIIPEEKDES